MSRTCPPRLTTSSLPKASLALACLKCSCLLRTPLAWCFFFKRKYIFLPVHHEISLNSSWYHRVRLFFLFIYLFIYLLVYLLVFIGLFIYWFIYLFIYGWLVGSSFLCEGFLWLRQVGATPHRGARASHYRSLSCRGAQAPDTQAQQSWLTGPVAPRHVGSSQTRARTRVPCIGRQTLNHCATREAPSETFLKGKGSVSIRSGPPRCWSGFSSEPFILFRNAFTISMS